MGLSPVRSTTRQVWTGLALAGMLTVTACGGGEGTAEVATYGAGSDRAEETAGVEDDEPVPEEVPATEDAEPSESSEETAEAEAETGKEEEENDEDEHDEDLLTDEMDVVSSQEHVVLPSRAPEWVGGGLEVPGATGPRTGDYLAQMWLPGLDRAYTCSLTLAVRDEEFDGTVSLMATTGEDPRAAVLFSVTEPAEGLQEPVQRAYLHPLDVAECHLGPRVDLGGEALGRGADALSPRFVGFSDEVLAVSVYGTMADTQRVVGYDMSTDEIVWEHDSGLRPARNDPAARDLVHVALEDGAGLMDVTSGEMVYTFGEDFDELDFRESVRLEKDVHLIRAAGFWLLRDGELEQLSDVGSWAGMTKLVTYPDGPDEAPVLVDEFTPADDSSELDEQALARVEVDGTVTPILSTARMNDLSLTIIGSSQGQLHARSSSERLVLDLDGEIVGDPLALEDVHQGGIVPESEVLSGGQVWTVWPGSSFSQESVVTSRPELEDLPSRLTRP